MVLVKKNSLEKNIPSNDIKLIKNHLILINNEITPIQHSINDKTIFTVDNNSYVYNIILLNKNFVRISNLLINIFGIDESYLEILKS